MTGAETTAVNFGFSAALTAAAAAIFTFCSVTGTATTASVATASLTGAATATSTTGTRRAVLTLGLSEPLTPAAPETLIFLSGIGAETTPNAFSLKREAKMGTRDLGLTIGAGSTTGAFFSTSSSSDDCSMTATGNSSDSWAGAATVATSSVDGTAILSSATETVKEDTSSSGAAMARATRRKNTKACKLINQLENGIRIVCWIETKMINTNRFHNEPDAGAVELSLDE